MMKRLLDYFDAKEFSTRLDIDESGVKKAVKAYEILSVRPEYQEIYNQYLVSIKI